jgi:hypothetical protein
MGIQYPQAYRQRYPASVPRCYPPRRGADRHWRCCAGGRCPLLEVNLVTPATRRNSVFERGLGPSLHLPQWSIMRALGPSRRRACARHELQLVKADVVRSPSRLRRRPGGARRRGRHEQCYSTRRSRRRSAEFSSNVICITRTQAGGEYGRPVPLPTLPRLTARFPKGRRRGTLSTFWPRSIRKHRRTTPGAQACDCPMLRASRSMRVTISTSPYAGNRARRHSASPALSSVRRENEAEAMATLHGGRSLESTCRRPIAAMATERASHSANEPT